MLKKVPTVKTSCNTADFVKSCIKAWFKLYKTPPLKNQIAVIYAQNALETGNTYNMYCWNIGNIKAADTTGQTIEYCALNGVWEIINGKKVVLTPDDPGSWFRAFETLDDGIDFYIDFIKNHRYKTAWTAIESGDPAAFGHYLKLAGYYTAPEADYVNGLKYNFNVFMNGKTFDAVMVELEGYFNQVQFPDDYKPIDMMNKDVISDTVDKK